MIKKRKNVKITLCDPPNSFCNENAFEVKKVVNTLQEIGRASCRERV